MVPFNSCNLEGGCLRHISDTKDLFIAGAFKKKCKSSLAGDDVVKGDYI